MVKRLRDLPIGALVKDPNTRYNGVPIVWKIADKNHNGYPSNTVTLISDKILSIKAFDAMESRNSNSDRRSYGNNNYKNSNLLQWLNSGSSNWYSAQHGADAPPSSGNVWSNYNAYDNEPGFLYNFSSDFKNAMVSTNLKTARSSTDGSGSETVTSKIFLASTTEVGLANENGIAEGTRFPIFDGDESRKAYPTSEAVSKSNYTSSSLNASSPWWWWLRTPYASYSYNVRHVFTDGSLSYNSAYNGSNGVRPLCNLKNDVIVSDYTGSDGAYEIKWSVPPAISGDDLDLGSKTDDFQIEYVVTDKDGDSCTVDILVDSIKKVTNKSVWLGIKNIYEVNLNDFTLGRHSIKIIAKDSKEASSERIYTFSKSNSAPAIDGENEDLGGKSTAFTQTYRVTDRNNDDISVVVTLDDLEISNVSSAQNKELSVTITDEQLQGFEIGSTHTITIKADDGKGGVAYRRYTFTKVNRPPIISGSDTNLGDKKKTFSVSYSLTDIEKDKIYCKIYLDGKIVREDLEVVDSKNYTYAIPHDDFIRLPYGEHRITIEAWDDENVENKQYRIYKFKRVSNGLEVEIKINEFTIQPKKVIAVPHGIFSEDSVKTVKVCNNYLDESPKWEDATTESKAARAYAFKNKTKTAEKWSIGVKIIVENGVSGVASVLRGVKGGYE